MASEKAVTAIGFTHRARAFFTAHGIDHIHRVVTDNGSCYRAHDFAKVLLGARHQRITPYTPRHNGKVERYQRTLGDEFLHARVRTSEQQRIDALAVWNVHYNYHRPHTAAGNRPPATWRGSWRLGVTQDAVGCAVAPRTRIRRLQCREEGPVGGGEPRRASPS